MEIEEDQHDTLPDQISIPLATPTQRDKNEILDISQYKSVRDLGQVKAKCFRASKEKETAVIGLGGAVLRVYGHIAGEVYAKAANLQKKGRESASASFDVWVRFGEWSYSQRCFVNTEVRLCEEEEGRGIKASHKASKQ